jgi:deoxyadenosine/deoxycytidine kinase
MDLHDAITSYSIHGIFQNSSDEMKKYSQLKGRIIAIEGPIGVGKTTLGQSMAAYLNQIGIPAIFLEEKYNIDFLELFCKGTVGGKNYGFPFQMSMLNACQHNYLEAEWHSGKKSSGESKVVIVDRTIWGNAVFAAMHHEKGNITDDEFQVYLSCIKQYSPYKFDHIIYLDIDPKTSHRRIQHRARESEKVYTLEYLQSLDRAYYYQIYTQLKANQSNILVLSNENFYESTIVLDKLIDIKSRKNFKYMSEYSPDKNDNLIFDDIRKGFELLCKHFD